MEDYRINTNYAKALFLLAGEFDKQDEAATDMRLVSEVCAENRELNVVFKDPTIKESKKVAIVTALFAQHVAEVTMKFLTFVVRKNRTVNLKGIANAYLGLYRDSRGIVLSQFTTATAVDEPTLALASSIIADHTHKKVEMVSKVDGRMLGGFKMEYDNNMYDARLRTKLRKLRAEFSKNIYESKL